jgi:hypothetical protein
MALNIHIMALWFTTPRTLVGVSCLYIGIYCICLQDKSELKWERAVCRRSERNGLWKPLVRSAYSRRATVVLPYKEHLRRITVKDLSLEELSCILSGLNEMLLWFAQGETISPVYVVRMQPGRNEGTVFLRTSLYLTLFLPCLFHILFTSGLPVMFSCLGVSALFSTYFSHWVVLSSHSLASPSVFHNPSSHLSMCNHLGTPAPCSWKQCM